MESRAPEIVGGQVDPKMLRTVCGHFVTGVTVITTALRGEAAGATVNSFTSVSLDPPLVLFCLHRGSRFAALVHESGSFAVNFLAGGQERVAWAFAAKETARFHDLPHQESEAGGPILREALAYLCCRTVNEFDGGDHTIFVGEVVRLGVQRHQDEPLVFYRGAMKRLEQEFPAAYAIWDG
jgi:3-hydroxy-9,10-secoandrosta-1,3,5(10)-triene-9,17-dione monooxygenase reductase component